ncbi:Serpentine Receptor, class Z [Caenorhabditis elegans]|uniref:Serpentine Receptor, class Z n=1 Tax=Caenorhabditis elegans TaxID=6239 RepID=Q5WRN2_CAEEL|nr:Serpentine Receptor, class Z [Caenorhabditis elegans]CAH60768.3 Serpentine Receptor, class Z [Caenorhabditis elegans]|eukprot:NP_001023774.2 Serpentine Receptor, class Z [Caenorhabditis elegans]
MNTTLDLTYIPDLLSYSSGFLLEVFFFISCLIIPFYFYVHNLNWHKEKDFPIVQFFYKMVLFSYFLFSTFILYFIVLYLIVRDSQAYKTSVIISFSLIFVESYIFHVIQQIIHILLFLLAIANSIKYLLTLKFSNSQIFLLNLVKKLNVVLISKDFLLLFLCYLNSIQYFSENNLQSLLSYYMILLLFLNIVLPLLTPLIYIPVMIVTRKNSHQHSQQHIYLHEYVFFQSCLVMFFKLVTLPYFLSNLEYNCASTSMLSMSLADVVTTPLIIQLSYLKCNIHDSRFW